MMVLVIGEGMQAEKRACTNIHVFTVLYLFVVVEKLKIRSHDRS